MLERKDATGRSNAVRLAAAYHPNVDGRQTAATFSCVLLGCGFVRPDPDGMTMVTAALISNNYAVTRYLNGIGLVTPENAGGKLPGEIARAAKAWARLRPYQTTGRFRTAWTTVPREPTRSARKPNFRNCCMPGGTMRVRSTGTSGPAHWRLRARSWRIGGGKLKRWLPRSRAGILDTKRPMQRLRSPEIQYSTRTRDWEVRVLGG